MLIVDLKTIFPTFTVLFVCSFDMLIIYMDIIDFIYKCGEFIQ